MTKFNQVKEKNIETLKLYIPIVDRVHGESHPEFHEVHRLFEEMNMKMKEEGSDKPELDREFKELRKVTDNYTVPADTCESYEIVYNILSKLDEAYYGSGG